MRRQVILILLVMALAMIAGGCAPSVNAPSPTAPAPAAATQTTAATSVPPTQEVVATKAAAPTGAPASTQAVAQPVRGGTLRVGLESESVTLDPAKSINVPERHILYSIYNTLVAMDEKLNIKPELAKSWDTSADGKTLTLHLQEGVKFQDGTDFDADAVKFNIERILDPKTGSGQRVNLSAIETVVAVDKYTVRLNLKRPNTPLITFFAERPGFMASPTAIQKWGDQYGQHPVGTGPFQLVEWVKDDHLTLQRFDGYWEKGLPYLDQIIIKPIPDTAVKLVNLKGGELDIVDDVAAKDIPGLQASKDYQVQSIKGSRWPMVRLNNAKPPFDNKALRQAVSYAIDRDAIIEAIYTGLATPAYGPVSPIYTDYFQPNLSSDGYSLDLQKAKEKLAEGGKPDGFSFKMDILTDAVNIRMAQVIQASLAKVGIKVDLLQLEPTAWKNQETSGQFESELGSFTPRPDPDGVVYDHFATKGSTNWVKYSNPEVDKLLEQERTLPLGPDRVKTLQQAEKLIVADAPWAFLVFQNKTTAFSTKVHGLPAIPDTMFRFKTVWLSK